MADLVNLRHFKKIKKRQEKAKTADRNRLKYGRTAAEKTRADFERRQADKHLDNLLTESQDTPPER